METSLGPYRVGLDFNPSGNDAVTNIKRRVGELIDDCERIKNDSDNPEVKRLAALAATAFEEGAMWAVKAITKQPR